MVVNLFGCCTLLIIVFIGIGSSENFREQVEILFGLYFYTPIFGGREVYRAFGGMIFSIRVAPHQASSGICHRHLESCICPQGSQGALTVEFDEVERFVHGRVKEHVFHFMESGEEIDRVVPSGAGKL